MIMMAVVPGDTSDETVETDFKEAVKSEYEGDIEKLERFKFYERAKGVACIVVTGEMRKYGNAILKKGVTPA